ncbi:putative GUP1-Multimembrane-spanning protein essential for proton symport of glycerol [Jaminaea rosea]|uniref:Putative GUP1-Multimembrane-spanning protein essential for proton symport of glycerol n=1 Tax=Jaminaea rosea TaxID=1569628 RepID=A0A316UUY2_9BASI|nr:putative GUP1-Multimembrane-spanning protein essential for proton symport of glycerol [Jaminaea rosea]PWN28141.1 putative GUP1-Multimembrane-spanning protein essential for proton symport of glycerol [Jaminaea rosea]
MPTSSSHQGAADEPVPTTAYPPSSSTYGYDEANGSGTSSSIWHKILGRRGIVGLTVDVAAPMPKQRLASTAARNGTAAGLASGSTKPSAPPSQPPASRWRTPEFYLYYLVFAIAIPLMVWVPIQLSQPSNPNYARFATHLKPGWLMGRWRDDSDFQYRSFRDYVPALLGIMGLYLALSAVASRLPEWGSAGRGAYRSLSTSGGAAATSPRRNRLPFLLGFTTLFLLALHGVNSLKLLTILIANYQLYRLVAGRAYVAPLLIWTFNVSMLAAVHWNDGFPWGRLLGEQVAGWLDEQPYTGLLPRWQINFNISMLRLVSYGLDRHWAALSPSSPSSPSSSSSSSSSLSTAEQPGQTDNRLRSSTPRPAAEYASLPLYLAHILYPPLFIAGPIMSFNDFASQVSRPAMVPRANVVRYAIRFGVCMLTMEFILHFIYVNAIKDTPHGWSGASPLELSMIGFWNLIIVWLKLLLPWRFFRLWALADGVDPPENMVRCMANNYSTLGFWRSWHRSYNLWVVRYIYVPCQTGWGSGSRQGGGRRNSSTLTTLAATLLVFTFVALWHDLSLRLLTWGWLITLFILPEVLCKKLIPASAYGHHPWYRHVAAIGGVGNVLLMMGANLVGFAIGVEGAKYLVEQLFTTAQGARFMVLACGTLFVGVQVMFEYREEEARKGIARKC